jgi:hypothetical protein
MSILILRSASVVAPAVGSLFFSGGSSTANSPTVRIPRTGAMDVNTFTIEMWLRPAATGNDQTISEGAAYVDAATHGNIIWDADSLDTRGFILGLSGGRIYIGVNTSGGARTLVGSTDITNDAWHHVYFYRNASSGLMELGVDGFREDTISGPTGDVTYDGNAPATDSFHYLAKEKLNFTFGYDGGIHGIRVSSNQRYSGATYTVPTAPLEDDANTIGLYLMDEQADTTMGDSSGNGFDGELLGTPVPTWSTDNPF